MLKREGRLNERLAA
jgi:aurora kinase